MENQTIKYGIIGCGKHALQSHAIPVRELADLELTMICDTSQESMENFERSYGKSLTKTTDRKVFFESDMDAIFIGTPDEFHYNDLIDAVNAEKHVFVEKPLSISIKELGGLPKVLTSAESQGLIVSSCHPRRFDAPFIWLREKLPDLRREYGEVISFAFDFSYHRPSKTWKHTRGLLLDHANHEVDLMHFLLGITGFKAFKLSDTHDQYKIVGRRQDGIDFAFSGTRRLESKVYTEKTTIRFEKGEVSLESDKGIVRLQEHETGEFRELRVGKTDYGSRGMKAMIDFAEAIKARRAPYLTHQDLYVNTATSVILTENDTWEYCHG